MGPVYRYIQSGMFGRGASQVPGLARATSTSIGRQASDSRDSRPFGPLFLLCPRELVLC